MKKFIFLVEVIEENEDMAYQLLDCSIKKKYAKQVIIRGVKIGRYTVNLKGRTNNG